MNILCVMTMLITLGADPAPAYKGTLHQQIQQAYRDQGGPARLPATNVQLPTFNNVGYAPVIVMLPEGVNMGASVSVSADRRYVRFSTAPTIMFSTIPQWSTYNIQTGQTITHRR